VLVDLAWFQSWKPGFVDAYQAALALDPSLFASSVRQELLDVSSGLDVFDPLGDGVFDEHDLKVYVDGFEAGSNPRFDLNGDGEVGGDGTAPFDLDVNSPPIFGAVELMVEGDLHPYDETAATDLEVLCYYAYSTLYTGDVDLRTELLAACHAGAAALTKIDVFGTAETTIGTVEDEVFDEYAWVDAEPTVGDATSESGGAGGSPALSATSSASSSAVVDEEGRLVSFTYSGLLDAVADPVVPYGGQQIWVAYATAFGHLYFDVPSGTTSVTITYGVEGGSGTNPDGSADTHGGCQLTSDSGSVFSDNFSFSSSDLTWGDTRSFVLSSGSYHLHLGASSRAGATSFLGGGELIEAFATGALDLEVTFAYE